MSKKLKWIVPLLKPLSMKKNLKEIASLACTDGSSDTGYCNVGTKASGDGCINGTAASGTCSTGSSATAACSSGTSV